MIVGGDLTVVGAPASNLLVFDGTDWDPVIPGFDGTVSALCFLPDGRLVVGAELSWPPATPIGHLAAWDGQQWDLLGGGTPAAPDALAVTIDAGIVAAGPFPSAFATASVMRWDGQGWATLGGNFALGWTGRVLRSIAALPDGGLLVGGSFVSPGGVLADNVARWDGAAWHALGTGANGPVDSIGVRLDGGIAIGGDFIAVDGVTSAYVARLAAPCAAGASSYGTTYCVQAGNNLALTVQRRAWTGGSLLTFASGLPGLGLGVACYGLAPTSLPLSSVGPSQSGCSLWVQPDFATVIVPVSGFAQSSLPIPPAPALVGQALYHQFLSLELTPRRSISTPGGTGGVALTIGALWWRSCRLWSGLEVFLVQVVAPLLS